MRIIYLYICWYFVEFNLLRLYAWKSLWTISPAARTIVKSSKSDYMMWVRDMHQSNSYLNLFSSSINHCSLDLWMWQWNVYFMKRLSTIITKLCHVQAYKDDFLLPKIYIWLTSGNICLNIDFIWPDINATLKRLDIYTNQCIHV